MWSVCSQQSLHILEKVGNFNDNKDGPMRKLAANRFNMLFLPFFRQENRGEPKVARL